MKPNLVLFFLVLLYISNQWARCSFPFLGNVAPPIVCSKPCNLESSSANDIFLFQESLLLKSNTLLTSNHSKSKIPLCPSFNCGNDIVCSECQSCLTENNFHKISLSYATCLSSYQYGFLSSYGYTIAFVAFTMIGGQIANARSQSFRKYLVVATAFGWAAATVFQGFAQNYLQLFISRILLGGFEAISTPFSYALIADIFPASELGRKNGLFTVGVYLGGALGSISIIFANWFGFQMTCGLIAIFSGLSAIGLASTSLEIDEISDLEESLLPTTVEVDDSENDKNEKITKIETKESVNESILTKEGEKILSFWTDSTLWCLYIGAGLRLFGGFALASYGPVFYGRRFPSDNIIYGTINAIITMLFGAISAYYGGVLSDKLTLKYDDRYRAYVPAIGCLLGFIPVVIMLFTSNFIISIVCLGIQTLLSECWMGPGIVILQNKTDKESKTGYSKERALSMYMFTGTLIGSLSPFIIGALDDGKSYESIQISLFMTLGISYIGASLCFFLLGSKIKSNTKVEVF